MADHQQTYKDVMSKYPTGVTIVTTTGEDGEPVGLTVNSFASVSIDPLLVLWSIDDHVNSKNIFANAKGFAVHILAEEQGDLCWTFARKDVDRFASCKWSLSPNGLPIIEGAKAVLQCDTYQAVPAGDHTVMIGKVIDIENSDRTPMIYYHRGIRPMPAEWNKE
ncbi:flavin reductase family protein [Aureibacillus halotolerans]|uniref:Flavin reductase (DIM6/NTAB) family NADH-FMN oxidoreductase RutF n=1 Tax=Aureibacillus halotolerans TaxID=1508390 RepID=A0A4R6UAK9_9BACI|nr:flavin reductase family protein [Aureibacillus halotolerans]TDQ42922.1 flavin reductase (DIM6/NTAB) family NADH-FMN oxidoreductase RutF [Aureibacillus halotolerans]